MTWKDRKHPLAGGAEVVNEELAKRLAADGHDVLLLVGGFADGKSEEIIDGYKVIRLGNRYTVYWSAYRYYNKHLQGWADLVIDEVNTIPFFAKFYVKEKNILFAHMLCRKIWFYEMPFPLSLLGYLLEPVYLWMLSDRKVIVVSESTKQDLMRFGFNAKNITIISEGIELEPIFTLSQGMSKYSTPTLLSLGSIRPMKRTADQIKAFEQVRSKIKNCQLIIAGDTSGRYGSKVLQMIKNSPYAGDITCLGKISPAKKVELMQRCHAILVTSVKEGWGLIVTEANSQGTPAVVYDVDGLRDSVRHNETGLVIIHNAPAALAASINRLLSDQALYRKLQFNAWKWSKQITFTKSYEQFKKGVGI